MINLIRKEKLGNYKLLLHNCQEKFIIIRLKLMVSKIRQGVKLKNKKKMENN